MNAEHLDAIRKRLAEYDRLDKLASELYDAYKRNPNDSLKEQAFNRTSGSLRDASDEIQMCTRVDLRALLDQHDADAAALDQRSRDMGQMSGLIVTLQIRIAALEDIAEAYEVLRGPVTDDLNEQFKPLREMATRADVPAGTSIIEWAAKRISELENALHSVEQIAHPVTEERPTQRLFDILVIVRAALKGVPDHD